MGHTHEAGTTRPLTSTFSGETRPAGPPSPCILISFKEPTAQHTLTCTHAHLNGPSLFVATGFKIVDSFIKLAFTIANAELRTMYSQIGLK